MKRYRMIYEANGERLYYDYKYRKIVNDKNINDKNEDVKLNKVFTIQVLNKCNLNCIHCCTSAENVTELGESECLDILFKLEKIIRKIIKINSNPQIYISGGEPLLVDGLLDLLKKYDNVDYTLFTNGLLLSNSIDLIGNVFNRVVVSIDYFHILSQKNELSTLIEDLKKLRNITDVSVIVVDDLLKDELSTGTQMILKKFESNGFNVEFGFLEPAGRAKNIKIESFSLSKYVTMYTTDNPIENFVCCDGYNESITVDIDGNCAPCYWFINGFNNINIFDSKFEWKLSESMMYDKDYINEFVKERKCKECKYINFCFACPKKNEMEYQNFSLTERNQLCNIKKQYYEKSINRLIGDK